MKLHQRTGCLGCQQLFTADPRNARHQHYCTAPACRLASKAASQGRWLAKPENQHYHCGPEAVARVRAWQLLNPAYRERQRLRRTRALQDFCEVLPEPPATEEKSAVLPAILNSNPPPESVVEAAIKLAVSATQCLVPLGCSLALLGYSL